MKKLGLALLFIPATTFADNVGFFGAEYAVWSEISDDLNVDAYTVGYEAVIDEKFTAGLNYIAIDVEDNYGYGYRDDYAVVNLDVALNSFSTGSLYAGLAVAFRDGDTPELFKLGYAKRSGNGVDYDIAVGVDDGETLFDFSMRVPLGGSGLGLTFGVTDSDYSRVTRVGINTSF